MTNRIGMLRMVLAAAVLAALAAGPVHAQFMKREIILSAAGGFQYATGDFGTVVKHGSGFRSEAGYFLTPSWAVSLGGAYHKYDAEPTTRLATGLSRVRYLSGSATATLYLYPESWFTPYSTGGFGIYAGRNWFGSGASESAVDKTRLGLLGGFGLSAHRQGSRLSVFTEVVYHHIITDNSASDQSVVWNTGLRLSFGGRPF